MLNWCRKFFSMSIYIPNEGWASRSNLCTDNRADPTGITVLSTLRWFLLGVTPDGKRAGIVELAMYIFQLGSVPVAYCVIRTLSFVILDPIGTPWVVGFALLSRQL